MIHSAMDPGCERLVSDEVRATDVHFGLHGPGIGLDGVHEPAAALAGRSRAVAASDQARLVLSGYECAVNGKNSVWYQGTRVGLYLGG